MTTKKAEPKMAGDITELLHTDHQKVRDLFFAFKGAETNGEKHRWSVKF